VKNYKELTMLENRKLARIKKRIKRGKEKNHQIVTCFFVSKNVIEVLKQEGYNVSYHFDQSRYGVATLYIIELNKK